MHTLGHDVSIWREVHKSETGQHISPKIYTHVHKVFSTHSEEKKILIVPTELNVNWDTH